jgi:predicted DNA-binding transcriptional regulator AlpA
VTVEALLLRQAGISPRHSGAGTQRLPCPECARFKSRPRDLALSLTIESDGHAVWFCHRCNWKGGTSGSEWRDTEQKIKVKRTGIYDRLDPKSPRYDPTFPRPIQIGQRAVAFSERELDAWIDLKKAARAGGKAA